MAKVKAPLFSFTASGKLADSLVYFPWKGLNCIRQWLVPANPQTSAQTTIRGYLAAAVAAIQAAQIDATDPLGDVDVAAYRVLAGRFPTPRTWWNAICKQWIDQKVAGKEGGVYRGGALTPGDGQIAIEVYSDAIATGDIETGNFWYGTTPSTLLLSQAATPDLPNNKMSATITGLTNGTPYYIQFVPLTTADYVGVNSGIYKDTPSA